METVIQPGQASFHVSGLHAAARVPIARLPRVQEGLPYVLLQQLPRMVLHLLARSHTRPLGAASHKSSNFPLQVLAISALYTMILPETAQEGAARGGEGNVMWNVTDLLFHGAQGKAPAMVHGQVTDEGINPL